MWSGFLICLKPSKSKIKEAKNYRGQYNLKYKEEEDEDLLFMTMCVINYGCTFGSKIVILVNGVQRKVIKKCYKKS